MGLSLEPVLGLLRYVHYALISQNTHLQDKRSILKNLLRLADPSFAALLERYVTYTSLYVKQSLIPEQKLPATVLRPLQSSNSFLTRHAYSCTYTARI